MYRMNYLIPIWLVYLGLTANFEINNLIFGALISLGIVLFLKPAPFEMKLKRLPVFIWGLVRYVVVLAFDIIQSGFTVARIVIHPNLPIRPGIIAIPTQCESDLARSLSAHATTITPGELVVEIGEDGTLYTHCLDASKGSDYVLEAQKLRRELLEKIVG